MPTLVDPASYLHLIANWDGQWYRQIATHGYPSHVPVVNGAVQQNAWAFAEGDGGGHRPRSPLALTRPIAPALLARELPGPHRSPCLNQAECLSRRGLACPV
jgi:hypothetical protein